MDDENGDYFADIEEDGDETVEGPGSEIIDGGEEGEAADFVSDSSSIIDELCFGDDDDDDACGGEEGQTEVLGALVPLSPADDGQLALHAGGSRRVSIVNGLEEELPEPVVIIMVVKRRREFFILYVSIRTARIER